ncbi:hypothetical protein L9F63_025430, partial [Diploptera punctata]
ASASYTTIISGESTQSFKDAVGPLARECMATVEATEDDYETVLNRNPLDTRSSKCLLACVYEKLGGLKPDGQVVSGDELMPIMDRLYSFKEFKTVMRTQVVSNCVNEVNGLYDDKCELVQHFLGCITRSY